MKDVRVLEKSSSEKLIVWTPPPTISEAPVGPVDPIIVDISINSHCLVEELYTRLCPSIGILDSGSIGIPSILEELNIGIEPMFVISGLLIINDIFYNM
jgi:hypothetical protein